jgi:hypothetical protein
VRLRPTRSSRARATRQFQQEWLVENAWNVLGYEPPSWWPVRSTAGTKEYLTVEEATKRIEDGRTRVVTVDPTTQEEVA